MNRRSTPPGTGSPDAARHAPSGWRRWRRVAAAGLLTLACGEVATRLLAGRIPAVRALAAPHRTRGTEPTTVADLQRSFGHQMEPRRLFFGFRCNSLGFHDTEWSPKPAPETARIVVLGDSFAHAMVPFWHSYLARAEIELLRRATAGTTIAPGVRPPVEIDNLGIPATGIVDDLWIYRLVGRSLEPDVVVINLYLGNDLYDYADSLSLDVAPLRAVRSRSWLWTAAIRMGRLARERWLGIEPIRATPPDAAAGPPGRVEGGDPGWSDDRPPFSEPGLSDAAFAGAMAVELNELTVPGHPADPHDWPAIESALDELVGTIEIDGARVILALAPSRLQIHPEELADHARRAGQPIERFRGDGTTARIIAYGESRGLPVIDLTPALRAAAGGRPLYRRNDTHWNLLGNQVAGEELARRLFALGAADIPAERRAARRPRSAATPAATMAAGVSAAAAGT